MPCGGDCRSGKCLETGGHNMVGRVNFLPKLERQTINCFGTLINMRRVLLFQLGNRKEAMDHMEGVGGGDKSTLGDAIFVFWHVLFMRHRD